MPHTDDMPAMPEAVGQAHITQHRGGIYGLPIVGRPARATREFFDDMAPQPGDSKGVTAGKQVLRYGTVVGAGVAGTAVAAVIVL